MASRLFALGMALAIFVSVLLAAKSGPYNVSARSLRDVRQDNGPIVPIPLPPKVDPFRSALGHELFFDLRLSRTGNRSCASCHNLATNGASRNPKDTTASGVPLAHNTPTVFNAGLSNRLDWNGDAGSLEEQAEIALLGPDFMNDDWADILGKLRGDHALNDRFRAAYGRGPDRENVLDAIGSFETTLVTPSRFDRWLEGDPSSISSKEISGFRLFQAIGCAACHQGRNVGGNLFEKVGIFGPLHDKPTQTLRVPSLRNVAVTPPYFDDGSTGLLSEAVKQMAKAQLGRDLTAQQNEMIVAFLETLTGVYQGHQLSAPK